MQRLGREREDGTIIVCKIIDPFNFGRVYFVR
jgi:hypothetical protein